MNTARAFTLVEMTIVIGIIILLAGLTLAVSVSVVQGSEVRQTELTIRLLDAAVQEWQAQSDRQVTYGIDGEPPPFPGAPPPQYEIQQDDPQATRMFLTIIERSAAARDILAQIDPEFVRQVEDDNDPQIKHLEILDAWGNALAIVMPGRLWVSSDAYTRDDDGTIQTPTEQICGVASNRQICFVSAGPDDRLGDLTQPADSDEFKQAQDNLYSYTPIAP